jgi:hypothetical protein
MKSSDEAARLSREVASGLAMSPVPLPKCCHIADILQQVVAATVFAISRGFPFNS